jgi:hypothetical protein
MKLPFAEKFFSLCERHPVFVVFSLALAFPGYVVYIARDFAQAPPQNFAIFAVLSAVALVFVAYLAARVMKMLESK